MGRYIDWADVTERYTDVAANVTAERAAYIITDAEGEVEARLAPYYTTPFASSSDAPQLVRTLSIDLAYYRMIWMSERADKLKAYIDERFKAITEGKMELVNSAGALSTDALPWLDRPYRSSFGPDDPVNWSVSSGAQDAAAWERVGD